MDLIISSYNTFGRKLLLSVGMSCTYRSSMAESQESFESFFSLTRNKMVKTERHKFMAEI
jgi:hypothetical protein